MEWLQQNMMLVITGLFVAWMVWARVVRPKMAGVKSMSANEYDAFKDMAHTLLDVRSLGEWNSGHAKGAVHIPLNEVERRINEIPKSKPVVVICASGMRSSMCATLLGQSGFTDVYNYTGGMGRWRGMVA